MFSAERIENQNVDDENAQDPQGDITLPAPFVRPFQVGQAHLCLPYALMCRPKIEGIEKGILKTVEGTAEELAALQQEDEFPSPMANELMFLRLYADGTRLQAFAAAHYPGVSPAGFPVVIREINRVVKRERGAGNEKFREVFVPELKRIHKNPRRTWGFVQQEKGMNINSAQLSPEEWSKKIFKGLQSTAVTLAFLEAEGIVHGDIKLGQILMTDDLQTTLIDFEHAQKRAADGMWKLMSGKEKVGDLTFLSITPRCASPEQLAEVIKAGSAWSTVYSLEDILNDALKSYQELGITADTEQLKKVPVEVSSKTDVFCFALSVLKLVKLARVLLSDDLRALLQRATNLMPADRPTMKEFADAFVKMSVQDSLTPESLENV